MVIAMVQSPVDDKPEVWFEVAKRSELLQVLDDLRAIPLLCPDKFAAHGAAAVDDRGFWIAGSAIEVKALLGGVKHGRKIHAELAQELMIVVLIGIHAYAQNRHLRSHPSLELNQRRHFI